MQETSNDCPATVKLDTVMNSQSPYVPYHRYHLGRISAVSQCFHIRTSKHMSTSTAKYGDIISMQQCIETSGSRGRLYVLRLYILY